MDELWANLVAGRSGIGKVTLFDAAELGCPAGEVKNYDPAGISPKESRRMARFTRFAIGAADEALAQAGVPAAPESVGIDSFRFGVYFSNGAGGVEEYEHNAELLSRRGPGGVSAFFIPKFIPNSASGTLAIRHKLRGPNFDPVSACASSSHSIGESMWTIKRGDADMMLAGGSEACLTLQMMSGFNALTALSRATPPETASRPFDRDRDGFVMAEGAAALVLEELGHAQKRGAAILAEVSGYGASCDATHITAPDPEGAGMIYAVRHALRMAGCAPEEVGAIFAHGTGTVTNDRVEAKVFRAVFGAALPNIRICAVKSMIGHAMSAAGALAALAAVRTLETGILPPTINCPHPDTECGKLNVNSGGATRIDPRYVLVDTLGFGGHNAALVLKKWEGR
jgi:3-oxoacyl-(acyl-carrier-protein) synthase